MFFYYIYLIVIAVPVILVATILTALLTIIGSALGMAHSWGYFLPCCWARLICFMTFVKVKVIGRENINKGTSYVFVANHQGAYDIFSIYGYLGHNFRWMMKKALEKIPLVGYSCRVSGQIYVDNSSPSAIRETMKDAEKQLSKGMSVVVFPEGSRTYTGEVGRFKRGAYTLAVEFRLPVVPITIDGAFHVMPRTTVIPRPGTIDIIIHKPILPEADGHDLSTLIDSTRNVIVDSLSEKQEAACGK